MTWRGDEEDVNSRGVHRDDILLAFSGAFDLQSPQLPS